MHQDEPSLLTHLKELRDEALSEGGISTIIFCGKLRSENDLLSVMQTHRSIVEEEVNEEGVNITGFLIGQGNSILHLLEGPSFSVLRVLSRLAGHEDFFSDAPVQVGTIVYSVEDQPKRYFPEWYSCTIQERKSIVDDVTVENCKEIVYELAKRLLEVGNALVNESHELELTKYDNQLPGKSLVLALAVSPFFFTLEDFVRFYYDPYHISLESEETWPLERLVDY